MLVIGIFLYGMTPTVRKIMEYIFIVWLVGALIAITRYFVRSRKLHEYLKGYVPVDNLSIKRIYDEMQVHIHRKHVTIVQNDLFQSPITVGIFRPVIVMPFGDFTDSQIRIMLMHEITHINRRDLLWKWIAYLCKFVHWYNPVMYMIVKELDFHQEVECDRIACSVGEIEENTYMRTLVAMIDESINPICVCGMSEHENSVLRRIKLMKKGYKAATKKLVLFCTLMCVISCLLSYNAIIYGAQEYEEYIKDNEILIEAEPQVYIEDAVEITEIDNRDVEIIDLTSDMNLMPSFVRLDYFIGAYTRVYYIKTYLTSGQKVKMSVMTDDNSISYRMGLVNCDTSEATYIGVRGDIIRNHG